MYYAKHYIRTEPLIGVTRCITFCFDYASEGICDGIGPLAPEQPLPQRGAFTHDADAQTRGGRNGVIQGRMIYGHGGWFLLGCAWVFHHPVLRLKEGKCNLVESPVNKSAVFPGRFESVHLWSRTTLRRGSGAEVTCTLESPNRFFYVLTRIGGPVRWRTQT